MSSDNLANPTDATTTDPQAKITTYQRAGWLRVLVWMVPAVLVVAVAALATDQQRLRADFNKLGEELRTVRREPTAPSLEQAKSRRSVESIEPVDANIAGAPLLGDRNAPLGIIVYSDFQCPYCGRFSLATLPALQEKFIGTGVVSLSFRHFPLETIHPDALRTAAAGYCAEKKGRFWPLHDRLFKPPTDLSPAALDSHLRAVDLDPAHLKECLNDEATLASIRADFQSGQALGINGTPAFFIGTRSGDVVKVTKRISGAQPLNVFETVISELRRQQ